MMGANYFLRFQRRFFENGPRKGLQTDTLEKVPDAPPVKVKRTAPRYPKLKGSIGEGPNHSNFSDRSSVRILSEFNAFC